VRGGRLASAWVAFREAANRAASAGKSDAQAAALDHAARLEARLPRLTVRVAASPSRVEVRRDGVLLRADELDVATPIDPGPHDIVASAPGEKPWSRQIVAVEGTSTTVDIPPLRGVGLERKEPVRGPTVVTNATPGSGQRTVGLIVGAAGVATAVAGGIFGLLAKSANDEADQHCIQVDPRRCTAEGLSLVSDAKARALTSTVLFIFGGAAFAGGAILFFTAPSVGTRASMQLLPVVTTATISGSATIRW
jgi:hypothetical protein